MDDLFKQLLPQAPMVALFALMLYTVYNDGKAERAKLMEKLDRANDQLDDLKERVIRLEIATTGDKSPTHSRKPIAPGES